MEEKRKNPSARMLTGRRGEEVACSYLVGKGHQVFGRNLRCGHLEIDIITLDGDGVHFVEVKSRVAPVAAAPEENVTPAKQKKVAAAALRYLNGTRDPRLRGNLEVSFDVVAVTFDGGEEKVEWFPNAFYPMYL